MERNACRCISLLNTLIAAQRTRLSRAPASISLTAATRTCATLRTAADWGIFRDIYTLFTLRKHITLFMQRDATRDEQNADTFHDRRYLVQHDNPDHRRRRRQ
jgi:hypothetical protein